MSKITIEVDTKENVVSCKIDGEEFIGAKAVHINSFEDFDGKNIVFVELISATEKVGKDEDLRRTVRIASASDASAKADLKLGEAEKSPDGTLIKHYVHEDLSEAAFKLLGRKKKKSKQIY